MSALPKVTPAMMQNLDTCVCVCMSVCMSVHMSMQMSHVHAHAHVHVHVHVHVHAHAHAHVHVTVAMRVHPVMRPSCSLPMIDTDGRSQQPAANTAALASRCDQCSAEKPAKAWYRKTIRREVKNSAGVALPAA